ncbi:MAG: hypothetical protein ABR875_02280 [Minisyncoccia bacterium]|jgi:phosphomannomutase
MIYNSEIFRAYDIRGIYDRDFDDEFAVALGKAAVEYFKAGKILVGHDSRASSLALAGKLSESLTGFGCDVASIGLVTTPFFNFVLSSIKPDAGIMVTASHNPTEYGGFKIYDGSGTIIGLTAGLGEIKKIIDPVRDLARAGAPGGPMGRAVSNGVDSGNFKTADKKGEYLKVPVAELLQKYTNRIVTGSKLRKGELSNLKFNITGRKSVMAEVELILKKLDLRLTPNGFDIAFSFDEDSDRLIVMDSAGNKIGTDFVVGLLAKNSVRFLSKPKVVYDVHFSKGVIGKFKEWGIKSYRSKVGRFYLRDAMVKHRADIGGEISGHIYFKENNRNELPLLALLRLLRILAASKMSINEMIKPFQTWFSSGRLDFRVNNLQTARELIKKIAGKYPDGQKDELDGITIEYTDPEKIDNLTPDKFWWFNLRASNTEPVLRLIVEAKNADLLKEKVGEISQIIEEKNAA